MARLSRSSKMLLLLIIQISNHNCNPKGSINCNQGSQIPVMTLKLQPACTSSPVILYNVLLSDCVLIVHV